MQVKIQPIDILQMTLERIYDTEKDSEIEFTNYTWYAMAIKDLAVIQWLDPNNYWTSK